MTVWDCFSTSLSSSSLIYVLFLSFAKNSLSQKTEDKTEGFTEDRRQDRRIYRRQNRTETEGFTEGKTEQKDLHYLKEERFIATALSDSNVGKHPALPTKFK